MGSASLSQHSQEPTLHATQASNSDNQLDLDNPVRPEHVRSYNPRYDKRDMYRLGKKQELKRRFKYFSIAGYVIVLSNSWEFAIVTSVLSISNGGTAGAIWTAIFVCLGMFLGVLSMAEVASMAPTSGGQYHWVSEISPPRFQKQLSYAVGWMAALGWQVGLPACSYVFAQQILALITVCDETYIIRGWHGSLMTIASATITIVLSIFVMQKLTLAEGIAVVVHCFGFVVFLTVLWVMGPKAKAYDTFFHFEDQNGWGNLGVASLAGLIGPISTFIGGDSAVHLAEELQDASYILPRAMVSASAINYVVGIVSLISFMFNIGPIDDSLCKYGGQPWIAVIHRITGSRAATITMIVIVATNFFCLQINLVMTSSRQLWAFARDKGFPFHAFLAKVEPDGMPRNAVVVTLLFTALLSLLIIGSSSAFNVILSFGNAGIYTSYIIILGCIIYRRFDGNEFPPSKFTLGKSGLWINIGALMYLIVALVFLFFPAEPDPDPAKMNWAPLMFGVVLIIAFTWYVFKGRKEYDGPVEYIREAY
ncbi:amino acid transporter [Polychaeton citri CBS 116435]|uniref:Amino acid transporter n=1 Tax=Polychaeton citri CBS 116435 TaxID=1314669 RepID=A0A9P4Q3V2_9PEZI|nr:amino acid transporter [Polychaeton citri CBS 116435]